MVSVRALQNQTCRCLTRFLLASVLLLLVPVLVTSTPLQAAGSDPGITGVTPITTRGDQLIVISGFGFGTRGPYSGLSPFIQISDLTGNWNAGCDGTGGSACAMGTVTLNVALWVDNTIIVNGFAGGYGQGNAVLHAGDQLAISVWNVQSRSGPSRNTVQVVDSSASPLAALPDKLAALAPDALQELFAAIPAAKNAGDCLIDVAEGVVNDNVPTKIGDDCYGATAELLAWTRSLDDAEAAARGRPRATFNPAGGPTNLQATVVDSSSIRLDWTNDPSNVDFPVDIVDGLTSGTLKVVSEGAATYTLVGLAPATKYCMYVRAESYGTISVPSNPVCVTTPS